MKKSSFHISYTVKKTIDWRSVGYRDKMWVFKRIMKRLTNPVQPYYPAWHLLQFKHTMSTRFRIPQWLPCKGMHISSLCMFWVPLSPVWKASVKRKAMPLIPGSEGLAAEPLVFGSLYFALSQILIECDHELLDTLSLNLLWSDALLLCIDYPVKIKDCQICVSSWQILWEVDELTGLGMTKPAVRNHKL